MKEPQTKHLNKISNKCNFSNKCKFCKKKSVININCTKCNKIFCVKHCCPEIHNCDYDHKKDLKMPNKISSSKIDVI